MFAKAFGARVIALDVGEERLQMAKDFGADYVVNPLKDDPVKAIKDLTRD
jgi:threonine dehydrogenase-like Zn-dependent dehydrogenase